MTFKFPALLIFSALVMFTAMILTLTHSGFTCEVSKSGADKQQCSSSNISETKDSICQGSVFQVSTQIEIPDGETFDMLLVCPFGFWTTFTNLIGVIAGLVFTTLTILQRLQKEFGTRKFAVRLGFLSVLLVFISVIVMGTNINGGMNDCRDYEAELANKGKTNGSDCSVAAFAWDISLMCVGIILLGFEAYLEFVKYKFGEKNQEYSKEENATQLTSDYQTRFFENNN